MLTGIFKDKRIVIAALMLVAFVVFVPWAYAEEGTNPDEHGNDMEWWNFRNNHENNGVSTRPAITSGEQANLKWAVKLRNGEYTAPTPPIIINGKLYTASGTKLYELNKETGEVIRERQLLGTARYSMNPIVYGDGKLFVLVENIVEGSGMDKSTKSEGMVMAFDIDTFDLVWRTEAFEGQPVTPIAYRKINGSGYIVTATWGGSTKDGRYFCVSTDDTADVINGIKRAKWTFVPSQDDPEIKNAEEGTELAKTRNRGFYWSGAYFGEKYIAFGSEDGSDAETGSTAAFYTVNPETGNIISKISDVPGDVKSTAVYDNGFIYFITSRGILYRVPVDENGVLGTATTLDLGGSVRSAPLIYKNRLYAGVEGAGSTFSANGGHTIKVVDVSRELTDGAVIKEVDSPGFSMAASLMSTSYEAATGKVYIYSTLNTIPGEIFYFADNPTSSAPVTEQGDLFIPYGDMSEHCISTICQDREGTMYYKNDSGYLMAVEKNEAPLSGITVKAGSANVDLDSEFRSNLPKYTGRVSSDVRAVNLTLSLPSGVSATVQGAAYSSGMSVPLNALGDTEIKIVTNKESDTRTYTLSIVRMPDDSSLSDLYVNYGANSNSAEGGEKQPFTVAFDPAVLSYETVLYSGTIKGGYFNIWPKATNAKSGIKVYAVTNVNPEMTNSDGSIDVTGTSKGRNRYGIYFADPSKNARVRIVVTSENGKTSTTYNVRFVRKEGDDDYAPPTPTPTPNSGGGGSTADKDINSITPSDAAANKAKVVTSIPKVSASGIKTAASTKKKIMTVSFKKVKGATNYRIAYRKVGASKWTYAWTGGKTTYTIKKMKAGGLYQFKLAVYKKSGSGVWTRSAYSAANYRYFQTVKASRKAGKSSFTVKVKKVKKATGYQVLYSQKKSMAGAKIKTAKGASKTTIKVSKLKKGKTYYVQVRPIKKYKGKTYLGITSSTKVKVR